MILRSEATFRGFRKSINVVAFVQSDYSCAACCMLLHGELRKAAQSSYLRCMHKKGKEKEKLKGKERWEKLVQKVIVYI